MSSDWSDLYNSDVTIRRAGFIGSSIGSPAPVWRDLATIRGMKQNTGGSESVEATGEVTEETFDLFIDYGQDVTQADIAVIGGLAYDIVAISNEGGHDEILKLSLRKRK
jgi:SPP1 family predicted phage head-tail adaptor